MLALLLSLSAHAIDLSAAGACGDDVRLEVSDATPGDRIVFMLGTGPGDSVVPVGRCAGTDTGLDLDRPGPVVRTDRSGGFVLDWAMPEGLCGQSLAVLDMSTCDVSDPVVLGAPVITYTDDIAPILDTRCVACHYGGGASGGVNFDTYEELFQPSVDVPGIQLITPGSLEESYLYQKVNGTPGDVGGGGSQMPLSGGPLSADQIDLIGAWILGGALE